MRPQRKTKRDVGLLRIPGSIALCLATFIAPAFANPLPPSAPGTAQPQIRQDGRATATVLISDTDYGYLRDLRSAQEWDDHLKNLPLGASGDIRLSLSGLGYVEAEYFKDQNFGRLQGGDWFQNQRANLYADLNFAGRLRMFGALKHGDRNGSESFVAPVQRDDLDLHQAFVELRAGDFLGLQGNDLLMRAGRQELHYGAGRMISIRQGPNLRDDFDGALVRLRQSDLVVDLFGAFEVTDEDGAFDNATETDQGIWGLYAALALTKPHTLDLYYIGDRNQASRFIQGTFDETRHSVGARWWFAGLNGWSGDLEATYQFGNGEAPSSGTVDLSAWSLSGSVSYGWKTAVWSPRLRADFGIASGDDDSADGSLGTFRAPNPPGRYFGETSPFGPANLTGGSVSLTVSPTQQLTLQPGANFFWRLDDADGVYSPAGTPVRGAAGNENFAGWEFNVIASYRLDRNWSIGAEGGYFFPGAYIDDNPPSEEIGRFVTTLNFSF